MRESDGRWICLGELFALRRKSRITKADTDEVSRLTQALPAQVQQALRGAVPKDLASNLKRIEKLSKQLRYDLAL